MAYVLEPTVSVTHEVRRVARERVDEALDLLDTLDLDDTDIERVVHGVRKRCKEVRAVARLVRASLGDEFRRFNRLVGETADTLAPIRDAHAVLATFDDLRTAGTLAAGLENVDLDDVRSAHATAAEAATHGMDGDDPRIERARRLLTTAGESIDNWNVGDGFVTLGAGIEATYRAGRQDLRRARKKPTDDQLHEWRKSVKNLWYQTRLIQRVAPSVLQALVASLDDLSEALGDDHDLAVLIERLRSDPDRFGGKRQVRHAVRLARSQQDDLRRRAFRLGATVYAETPGSFGSRIGTYWKSTIQLGPELATGGIAELAGDEDRPSTNASTSSSSGTVERERKFLVAEAPELPEHGTTLRQGYLAIDRSVSVRVRDAGGDDRTLTIKAGRGPVRTELEWPISEQQFAAAWEQTGGRRIHKTRYQVPLDGSVVDFDVFHDELKGLIVAEVEFDGDESMAGFEPPPWFGTEVTDDVSYTNASLAVSGLPSGPYF